MKHPNRHRWITLGVLALTALTAPAAEPTRDEQATVRSHNVEFNQKTGTAMYRGDVKYTQGDLSLNAARVNVTSRANKAETVTATGNPVMARQRPAEGMPVTTIEAARLDYHVNERTLDLQDNVLMHRDEDTIRAATAHYDLNTGRLDARGDAASGERVQAVIQRRQETPAP